MLWVVVVIAILLVAAAVYDVIARRRGIYKGPAEWQEITSRRKSVKRAVRKRKDPTGEA